VLESYERMLAASSFRGRQVALPSNRLVHALEAGEGPPALLLHGSTTSLLSLLPLLDELAGVRAIAVDRPGFGLSDTIQVPRERFRAAAVEFTEGARSPIPIGSGGSCSWGRRHCCPVATRRSHCGWPWRLCSATCCPALPGRTRA
jgi:pimeloyl-ACP methyl ester carboxylesterase